MEKPILTLDDALYALKIIKEFCTMNEGSCLNCPFRSGNYDECALGYDAPNSWDLNEKKQYIPNLIL